MAALKVTEADTDTTTPSGRRLSTTCGADDAGFPPAPPLLLPCVVNGL
jgi:hypothetical protein